MSGFSVFVLYAIVILGLANLLRMAAYLISSDIYNLRLARYKAGSKRNATRTYTPAITVVIPAYNEEVTIAESVASVGASDYPDSKLKVIVANDGSKDNTAKVVKSEIRKLKKIRPGLHIRLLNLKNQGKATALNTALNEFVDTPLVMCLDADSQLHPDALRNAVQHFRDRRVVALSSNVNIVENNSLLSIAQRCEYLVCYQMKRGQALLNVEYIVGGIGSVFRRQTMNKVGYYDTNTMTEDIDLTMKILLKKTRNQRVAYAADSIVYTQPAHSLRELMRQRYRWKYGRSQTFLKHSRLFFSTSKQHRKRLSWFILPYALVQDLMFFIEPLIIIWFFYILIVLGDARTILSALLVISAYTLLNVWASNHLTIRQRLRLSYYTPPMYFLMYILTFAEYYALVMAMIRVHKLRASTSSGHITWVSPSRRQQA